MAVISAIGVFVIMCGWTSVQECINPFYLILIGKIILVYRYLRFSVTFKNKLSLRTEIPLYVLCYA